MKTITVYRVRPSLADRDKGLYPSGYKLSTYTTQKPSRHHERLRTYNKGITYVGGDDLTVVTHSADGSGLPAAIAAGVTKVIRTKRKAHRLVEPADA